MLGSGGAEGRPSRGGNLVGDGRFRATCVPVSIEYKPPPNAVTLDDLLDASRTSTTSFCSWSARAT